MITFYQVTCITIKVEGIKFSSIIYMNIVIEIRRFKSDSILRKYPKMGKKKTTILSKHIYDITLGNLIICFPPTATQKLHTISILVFQLDLIKVTIYGHSFYMKFQCEFKKLE